MLVNLATLYGCLEIPSRDDFDDAEEKAEGREETKEGPEEEAIKAASDDEAAATDETTKDDVEKAEAGVDAVAQELTRRLVVRRALLRRALKWATPAMGRDEPYTAAVCMDLARINAALGDVEGQRSLVARALKVYDRTDGPKSDRAVWCRDILDPPKEESRACAVM